MLSEKDGGGMRVPVMQLKRACWQMQAPTFQPGRSVVGGQDSIGLLVLPSAGTSR